SSLFGLRPHRPSFPTRRSSDLEPAFERADHELAVVGAEEVPRVLVGFLRRALGDVVRDRLLPRRGDLQVAGQDLPRDRVISVALDRKSTRLNSSHEWISYAVFC